MSEFVSLFQTVGLPVGLLASLCVFLWRVLIWLKPWVEKSIQGHIDLLDATSKAMNQMGDMHEKQINMLGLIVTNKEDIRRLGLVIDKIHAEGCKWGKAGKGGEA